MVSAVVIAGTALLAVGAAWWMRRFHSRVTVVPPPQQLNPKLRELVLACPSLSRPWTPVPWIRGGNAQTLAVAMIRRRPRTEFRREVFCTGVDGGAQVGLDWVAPEPPQDRTDAPVVVVMHGINGGSAENYIRHFAERARKELDCRVVVMVARGLGGVPMSTWVPYNAGSTADIRAVVTEIRRRYPAAPILGIGFSLGANILTRMVGEDGDSCLLTAAVTVSNPFDLVVGAEQTENAGLFVGGLYTSNMAKGLQRYTVKNAEMLKMAPEGRQADFDAVKRSKTIREYDDASTRRYFGFQSTDSYYADMSAMPYVHRVRTPMLCINAWNDPMSHPHVIVRARAEAGRSSYVTVAASEEGGHLGFLEARPGKYANWRHAEDSWAEVVACEFFSAALRADTTNN